MLLSRGDLGALLQGCLVDSTTHSLDATVPLPRLLLSGQHPLPRLAVGMEEQSFAQAWCIAAMARSGCRLSAGKT